MLTSIAIGIAIMALIDIAAIRAASKADKRIEELEKNNKGKVEL